MGIFCRYIVNVFISLPEVILCDKMDAIPNCLPGKGVLPLKM